MILLIYVCALIVVPFKVPIYESRIDENLLCLDSCIYQNKNTPIIINVKNNTQKPLRFNSKRVLFSGIFDEKKNLIRPKIIYYYLRKDPNIKCLIAPGESISLPLELDFLHFYNLDPNEDYQLIFYYYSGSKRKKERVAQSFGVESLIIKICP